MDLLKQLHHQEVLQPHILDEAMVSSTASAVGHNQKSPALETADTRVRAARQKAVILLVLLMAMPEAWWYLVYL